MADDFSMKLSSFQSGTVLKKSTVLKISLTRYPSATPAFFPIELEYRECFPADFSGPDVRLPEI